MRGVKAGLVLVICLVSAQVVGSAQRAAWTKKSYHAMMKGNELYEDCSDAEKHVQFSGERISLSTVSAAQCWAYVEAVVDAIPGGEGFEPDSDVRLSQYVDVVRGYLKEHPESRHFPAYYLSRTALTEAFPDKTK